MPGPSLDLLQLWGEDMAEAKVEEPAPFPLDARARQLREMANQVESCFVGDHAMALEWRWAGHPDQDVGGGAMGSHPPGRTR